MEPLVTKSRLLSLSSSERLALAKAGVDNLVHHIVPLFLMHESNAVVIYSQKLSKQIPRSYAAHAFNQFQRSMHLFELVRLCAMWDVLRDDRESIPTIIGLFNEPELIDRLVAVARAHNVNEVPPETVDSESASRLWKEDRKSCADRAAATVREKLSFAVSKAEEILTTPQLKHGLLRLTRLGGDSGAAADVIQAAGWSGGQRAWEVPTRWICGNVLLRRLLMA
jgi:hypothetical protein